MALVAASLSEIVRMIIIIIIINYAYGARRL